MKTEKKLFPLSIKDAAKIFLLFFIPIFVFTLAIEIIYAKEGIQDLSLKQVISDSFILLFAIPLIFAFTFSMGMRKGILIVHEAKDAGSFMEKLEKILKNQKYQQTEKEANSSRYVRKAKMAKLGSGVFLEDVQITKLEEEIHISGRRNILEYIDSKLKWYKTKESN